MPFSDVIGHERAKTLLQAAIRHQRVAQAYLFHGPDRIGKRRLAIRFIQSLSCDTLADAEPPDACGECRSCQQIESGSHPDLCLIVPDRSGAAPRIKIDDIRELESRLIYRPLLAERKYCLIDDAEALTIEAANALLKTLEEPPGHSLLILLSSRPYALPATIRSRCQSLRLIPLSHQATTAALVATERISDTDAQFLAAVSEGRLGEAFAADLPSLREQHEAIATLTSPQTLGSISTLLTTADTLAKGEQPTAQVLERLAAWVHDLVLLHIHPTCDRLAHPGHAAPLRAIAERADIDGLLDVLHNIDAFQRQSTRNLNAQLMLEEILLLLRDATRPQQTAP